MIDNLFESVGGRRTISAAVDSFYRRVLADETVKHFFDATDMEHLRARQSMFVSMLVGGKIVYTGKDLTSAHARSRMDGLNDAQFDTLLKHFRDALNEAGVAGGNVEKIMALLEGTRSAVLNRGEDKARP
jgi:hemoglobin